MIHDLVSFFTSATPLTPGESWIALALIVGACFLYFGLLELTAWILRCRSAHIYHAAGCIHQKGLVGGTPENLCGPVEGRSTGHVFDPPMRRHGIVSLETRRRELNAIVGGKAGVR